MHTYWRLHITTTQGSSGGVVTIGEIEMRPYPGGPDQCSGGSASADGFYTSANYGPLPPPNAFDGVNTIGASWVSAVASLPHWIAYQFPAPVDVGEIVIGWPPSYGYPQEQPKDVALQYSDDGSSWTTRQSWTLASFSGGEMRALSVGAWATLAGTPRRPVGPATAAHVPPFLASAAGAPRRAVGPATATHYPPFFAALAGAPRRPVGPLQAAHTFRAPPHLLRTSYTLTLALDGLPDLLVPLATWQAVAQSEAATVLTCTAPYSTQLAADLADYTGATLRIDQHLHYTDRTLSGAVVSVPWDGAPRIDRGGRSQTVTLQGRQFPEGTAPPAKLVRLSGVQYLRDDDSGRSVRAGIDFFTAPGDTLDYGDGTIVPDRIIYVCSPGLAWMEARG